MQQVERRDGECGVRGVAKNIVWLPLYYGNCNSNEKSSVEEDGDGKG